jgi:hypothetical protein
LYADTVTSVTSISNADTLTECTGFSSGSPSFEPIWYVPAEIRAIPPVVLVAGVTAAAVGAGVAVGLGAAVGVEVGVGDAVFAGEAATVGDAALLSPPSLRRPTRSGNEHPFCSASFCCAASHADFTPALFSTDNPSTTSPPPPIPNTLALALTWLESPDTIVNPPR